jgi:lactoylglutathione lyase
VIFVRFQFVHSNRNVVDLEKSITFYRQALGLREVRRKNAEDGSFVLAFLEGDGSAFQLELTWLRDWKGAYDLGDNELHLAVVTKDYAAARALHEEMGCICYENPGMGIYFINDPDGYWTEIIPAK